MLRTELCGETFFSFFRTRNFAESTEKIASFVEVLPTEPVTPTIRGLYLRRALVAKYFNIFSSKTFLRDFMKFNVSSYPFFHPPAEQIEPAKLLPLASEISRYRASR